jgi:hypothetical protein
MDNTSNDISMDDISSDTVTPTALTPGTPLNVPVEPLETFSANDISMDDISSDTVTPTAPTPGTPLNIPVEPLETFSTSAQVIAYGQFATACNDHLFLRQLYWFTQGNINQQLYNYHCKMAEAFHLELAYPEKGSDVVNYIFPQTEKIRGHTTELLVRWKKYRQELILLNPFTILPSDSPMMDAAVTSYRSTPAPSTSPHSHYLTYIRQIEIERELGVDVVNYYNLITQQLTIFFHSLTIRFCQSAPEHLQRFNAILEKDNAQLEEAFTQSQTTLKLYKETNNSISMHLEKLRKNKLLQHTSPSTAASTPTNKKRKNIDMGLPLSNSYFPFFRNYMGQDLARPVPTPPHTRAVQSVTEPTQPPSFTKPT